MEEKKYNCAVIGCGRIGSLLEDDKLRCHPCTHAGAYFTHPKTKLIAGCDIKPDRLKYFGKKWSVPENSLFVDYRKLLERKDIEILSIAADTEFHFQMLKDALNCPNIIAILLEKPVVAKVEEAIELEKIVKNSKKKIFVNHERRFMSEYKFVKKIIEEERYKKLKTIIGNVLTSGIKEDWHSDWRKSGGGPLLHDGTHLIDIMTYFAGGIDYLIGYVRFPENRRKYQVEVSAFASLQFKNGIIGFIEASGDREYFNFELDLQFENGRIKIGNGIWEVNEVKPSRRYENFFDLVPANVNMPQTKPFFTEVIDDIILAIENDDYNAISTIYDGLNDFWIIMNIYYSGLNNNQKIRLPFKVNEHPFELLD